MDITNQGTEERHSALRPDTDRTRRGVSFVSCRAAAVAVAAALAVFVTTACTGAASADEPGAPPPQPTQIKWLKENAVEFDTVEAGNGFEDLEPLREIIGNARVVGLGESTHGSREQFQMKHRLVEFLAAEMGFNVFSIEASMPESYRVDDFVSRGEGDPVKLIRGMYFWTWSTEEVLAMVEWMRAFNLEHVGDARHIRFTGFDMQTPDVAAKIVVDALGGADPELAQSVRERYDGIMSVRPPPMEWTAFNATLAPGLVAGRKIVFTGQIRTDGAQYAALWFRADRDANPVAFMNTANQHRSGDAWTTHRVELDIPADVDTVVFGFIHAGAGRAWFDDIALTIDGEPYVDAEAFDFAMEEDGRGFYQYGSDYATRIDDEVFAAGKSSYRSKRITPLPAVGQAGAGDVTPAAAAEVASGVLDDLLARDDALVESIGRKDADWTLQMARVVAQCMKTRASGGAERDRSMADNVLWILEHDPDARVILWAHNGHIANEPTAMGGHLESNLGADYLPVGFATSRGAYRAVSRDRKSGLKNHALNEPPPGSIESFFDAAGLDLAVLDLRRAERGSVESGWLHEDRPFRSIGALEMTHQFFPMSVRGRYEVLVYVGDTTGAVPLRRAWSASPATVEE